MCAGTLLERAATDVDRDSPGPAGLPCRRIREGRRTGKLLHPIDAGSTSGHPADVGTYGACEGVRTDGGVCPTFDGEHRRVSDKPCPRSAGAAEENKTGRPCFRDDGHHRNFEEGPQMFEDGQLDVWETDDLRNHHRPASIARVNARPVASARRASPDAVITDARARVFPASTVGSIPGPAAAEIRRARASRSAWTPGDRSSARTPSEFSSIFTSPTGQPFRRRIVVST